MLTTFCNASCSLCICFIWNHLICVTFVFIGVQGTMQWSLIVEVHGTLFLQGACKSAEHTLLSKECIKHETRCDMHTQYNVKMT